MPEQDTIVIIQNNISSVITLENDDFIVIREDQPISVVTLGIQGPPGVVPQTIYMASEAIAAGAPVNIWDDAGIIKVRNANASSGLRAHGFSLRYIAPTDSGPISRSEGTVSELSGLVPGAQYVLGTISGTYLEATAENIATLTTNMYLQHLGVARTTSEIEFRLGEVTVRA
jgi:hypothetical protein